MSPVIIATPQNAYSNPFALEEVENTGTHTKKQQTQEWRQPLRTYSDWLLIAETTAASSRAQTSALTHAHTRRLNGVGAPASLLPPSGLSLQPRSPPHSRNVENS
ncbi:hypothetical protein LSTR_LSTR017403 [Laodelphax striatellus]|uniref:Uncharacterized protein n=1 Tax=Laodelphax striatellus TaxID=195883 RepID=A0A482WGQ6_LAOST|nr:hypothetical protein LSTR_LSTR005908 [Laodelphax striatellus]RZF39110.1 hypothetical protein LSTR_LSTR017403 [Laodelphax striatellus]